MKLDLFYSEPKVKSPTVNEVLKYFIKCYFPKETNNQLEEDGYQNVCEERSILPPDIDFLRLIQQIKPGGAEGDCQKFFSYFFRTINHKN